MKKEKDDIRKSKITFEIWEYEDGRIEIMKPNIGADGTNALNAGFGMGIIKSAMDYVTTWKVENFGKNINAVAEK